MKGGWDSSGQNNLWVGWKIRTRSEMEEQKEDCSQTIAILVFN